MDPAFLGCNELKSLSGRLFAVSLFDSTVIHTHLPFLSGTAGPRGLSSFAVFTHNLVGTLGASLGNYILEGPQDYLVGRVVIIAGHRK